MSKHDTSFIKILVLLFCLGLIQLTSGCARLSSEFKNNQIQSLQTQAIINGNKVFETDLLAKKVFYLAINSSLIKTPAGFAARQQSFCSAVVLHPSVVLTAAHCVDQILPENINLIEGVSPWISPLKPELWHQASKALVHPKYMKKNPEFDLALVQLALPMDPESVVGIHNNDVKNQVLTLAGFGFRVRHVETTATFTAENSVLKNNSGELFYLTKTLPNYASDQLTFLFEDSNKETVCIGDSGGPALIFDEEIQNYAVVGLLSGSLEMMNSPLLTNFQDFDFCSGTPIYSNLRHPEIRSWIDQSLNQLLRTNQL